MSVVAAGAFRANGGHSGIKADGKLDTAVIAAHRPVPAAAVFTTSTTAAPCVRLARERMADPLIQAIVVNSGCANAATGRPGYEASVAVGAATADALGCDPSAVLVASTGPIGNPLPVEKVAAAIPRIVGGLSTDPAAGRRAAEGIMTTDTVTKEAAVTVDGFTIGGVSKGAGMVRPDMATMLAYLTTDADVSTDLLSRALQDAVDLTFNSLNIDGCQSTNDMVVVLASGDSGVAPSEDRFREAITEVCRDLAWQMAKDAEGASRVVTIDVSGAESASAARHIGKVIADSALVRASFYGADANWGRIVGAVGVSGYPIAADDIDIAYAGTQVSKQGLAVPFDEAPLYATLEAGDFEVEVSVGDGPGTATIVTTDLTPEYAIFNGERS